MDISQGRAAIYHAAEQLKNWGRWGEDDQIGTLNHVRPEDIVAAAGLIKRGEVFAMGIPLDDSGPQTGLFGGRWNPIHTMLATGADAMAGDQVARPHLRYADDALNMPVQAATHWDASAISSSRTACTTAIDARSVDSGGVHKLGIEHTREKMVGRGVLLDVARYKGVDWLPDGYGIGNAELDATARAQGVEVRRGDFVIVRTGQMERCLAEDDWGGYAGGDAPGVRSRTATGARSTRSRRSARTPGASRCGQTRPEAQPALALGGDPRHRPDHGRDFYLAALAADCAEDQVYEFFFCGPPLVITGGTGSPINPLAIK